MHQPEKLNVSMISSLLSEKRDENKGRVVIPKGLFAGFGDEKGGHEYRPPTEDLPPLKGDKKHRDRAERDSRRLSLDARSIEARQLARLALDDGPGTPERRRLSMSDLSSPRTARIRPISMSAPPCLVVHAPHARSNRAGATPLTSRMAAEDMQPYESPLLTARAKTLPPALRNHDPREDIGTRSLPHRRDMMASSSSSFSVVSNGTSRWASDVDLETQRHENERLAAEARKLEEDLARAAAAERERAEKAAREQAEREAREKELRKQQKREARERAEAEERERTQRLAQEAIEQVKREEAERLAAERAAREAAERLAEEQRLRAEKEAAERAEMERMAREARELAERLTREKAEAEARERAEAARRAEEARKAEEERLAREEAELIAREAAEREAAEARRIAAEKRAEEARQAEEARRAEEAREAAERAKAVAEAEARRKAECPDCFHCNQPIFGERVMAMGNTYHPGHFVCKRCNAPFPDGKFHKHDGHPYCAKDYHELFSAKCAGCSEPITGKMVQALGKRWHPDHFVCFQCKKPFGGEQFHVEDGQPYCGPCHEQAFLPKCAKCSEPIHGEVISALGNDYHPEHFACFTCGEQFADGRFFTKDNQPYCKKHA
eukprot:TRINITY_DN2967_c0_g1_i1.p1 TRINITY_DN2967_c0_g1~~TRINITY_DN2967_c0_g1_i1.p1  ORF type:complete len:616 (+),score=174.76 TRINITY_DN2967_c0_g1_i1:128-1975(+)